jgi:hypothetical protein
VLSSNLEQYITDIFHQLDALHRGSVSREDFEALSEILGIAGAELAAGRRSGLEWLAAYRPGPHSPGSPLRLDRLGEAAAPRPPAPAPAPREPPSFLWTLGPRPFWELWPDRRRRRKHLGLAEFTEGLLERWAATHGYPGGEVRRLLQARALSRPPDQATVPPVTTTGPPTTTSRAQRLIRGAGRASRRITGLPRIGHQQNGGPASCNGANGLHRSNGGPPAGLRPGGLGPGKLSGLFLRARKEPLEQRLAGQHAEIRSLREAMEDLRGSLQLSDAQNLALQVALKRMAKAEHQLPGQETVGVRTKIEKSERQLENLISELREMGQTKYPTLSSQNYSTSSSSQGQGPEEELGQTQEYLSGVQQELRGIASRLRPGGSGPGAGSKDLSLAEAFSALVDAQAEVQRMRSGLDSAQAALEATQGDLGRKESELRRVRLSLGSTGGKLTESERTVQRLRENR